MFNFAKRWCPIQLKDVWFKRCGNIRWGSGYSASWFFRLLCSQTGRIRRNFNCSNCEKFEESYTQEINRLLTFYLQGPRSSGLTKDVWRKFFIWARRGARGHACGFLFNFPKVTGNAIITIKLLIFSHIFSDVAIGPENSPSLNWNIINCCVILLISTFNYYK